MQTSMENHRITGIPDHGNFRLVAAQVTIPPMSHRRVSERRVGQRNHGRGKSGNARKANVSSERADGVEVLQTTLVAPCRKVRRESSNSFRRIDTERQDQMWPLRLNLVEQERTAVSHEPGILRARERSGGAFARAKSHVVVGKEAALERDVCVLKHAHEIAPGRLRFTLSFARD